jgi:hypothetical protein
MLVVPMLHLLVLDDVRLLLLMLVGGELQLVVPLSLV